MTVTTDGADVRLKVYGLTSRAWRLAGSHAITQISARTGRNIEGLRVPEVEALLGRLTDAERADLWSELIEIGMAAEPGLLTDAWAAAIVESALPSIGIRVVSGYGEMSAVADLTMRGDRGMSVIQRRKVAPDEFGENQVTAEDAYVEVALFRSPDIWMAVRRTLPPEDALRADPLMTKYDERVSHTLDADTVAEFQRTLARTAAVRSPGQVLASMSDLESAFAEILAGPRAQVHMVVLNRPEDGREPGMAIRTYLLGEEDLYALHVRPHEGAALVEVKPGAVGFDVVWLVTGALERLSKTEQRGA